MYQGGVRQGVKQRSKHWCPLGVVHTGFTPSLYRRIPKGVHGGPQDLSKVAIPGCPIGLSPSGVHQVSPTEGWPVWLPWGFPRFGSLGGVLQGRSLRLDTSWFPRGSLQGRSLRWVSSASPRGLSKGVSLDWVHRRDPKEGPLGGSLRRTPGWSPVGCPKCGPGGVRHGGSPVGLQGWVRLWRYTSGVSQRVVSLGFPRVASPPGPKWFPQLFVHGRSPRRCPQQYEHGVIPHGGPQGLPQGENPLGVTKWKGPQGCPKWEDLPGMSKRDASCGVCIMGSFLRRVQNR